MTKPGRKSTHAPSDSGLRSTVAPSSATPSSPDEPNSDGWMIERHLTRLADYEQMFVVQARSVVVLMIRVCVVRRKLAFQ